MFSRISNWYKRRSKRTRVILLTSIALLITIRLCLPGIVRWYLLKELNAIEGYSAQIEDVDLYLYRLGMGVDGLKIYSTQTGEKKPLFFCERSDVSVQFSKIIKGKIVGKVKLVKPQLTFVVGIPEEEVAGSQHNTSRFSRNNFENVEDISWQKELADLIPITINKLEVIDGEIKYRDEDMIELVDFYMHDIDAEFSNLTNVDSRKKKNFANGKAKGVIMNSGRWESEINFNPLSEKGTYDVDFKVSSVYLPEFNKAFREYALIDAESGNFDCAIEVASNEGHIEGYMKPVIKKPKFFSIKNDLGKNPINGLWDGVAGLFISLHKNIRHNQIATKVNFHGESDNLNINLWCVYGAILKNAFFKAFNSDIEHSIDINTL